MNSKNAIDRRSYDKNYESIYDDEVMLADTWMTQGLCSAKLL